MRQIDENWEKLNSELGLLAKIEQSGFVELTASGINSIIGNPDARNLVSFNRRKEMPILFKKMNAPFYRSGAVLMWLGSSMCLLTFQRVNMILDH